MGVTFSAGKLFRVVQYAGDRNVPAPLTFDLRNWQKDSSYWRGDILVPLLRKGKGQQCPFSVGYTSAPAPTCLAEKITPLQRTRFRSYTKSKKV
ncbi:MAG: hypothetical protein ACJAYS_001212 [Lentimonas sp.]|jgi:hypothetical protein